MIKLTHEAAPKKKHAFRKVYVLFADNFRLMVCQKVTRTAFYLVDYVAHYRIPVLMLNLETTPEKKWV